MSYLKNNKALLLIIAALLVVNVILLYGYLNRVPKKERSERMNDEQRMQMTRKKLQEDVGFTNEQLNRYTDLRKKHFEGLRPMFNDLRNAKDSLFNILYKPAVSDSLINLYADQICERQKMIDTRMVNYLISLKAIATDDQKQRMDSFLMNMTRRMAGVPGGSHRGPDHKGKEKK